MLHIHPQYLKLADLLKGRLFRIPEYQRAYSWQTRQRSDLFEDIRKIAKKKDEVHFMATVVGLRRDKTVSIGTDEYHSVEIVDGQQRLTTLILLLKAIELKADDSKAAEKPIREELRNLLVKSDDASLILLQTNHDLSHYFADFLRLGSRPPYTKATTLADRSLLEGMAECQDFVDEWVKTQPLADLVKLLKNRLTFIFHEMADERIVYAVFETLNSRGLDVTWLDRLKSILMGIVFEGNEGNRSELIDEVHDLWGGIYRCIGLHQGLSAEALRFAATLCLATKPNRTLGEADSVETLRFQCGTGREVIETTKWVKKVVEAVEALSSDRRKNAVCKIAHARLLATAIHLRDDLDDEAKDRILRRWESVTFRIFGMIRYDSRTAVGDYVRLAWRVVREQADAESLVAAVDTLGERFPIADSVKHLAATDCYNGWQEELRYLLFRYEEHLAQEDGHKSTNTQWNRIWQAAPAQSIEHIMPQSTGGEETVHRLGNLVLLPPGLNSQLGATAPKDKATAYEKKCRGMLIVQDVVPRLPHWGKREIGAREKKILEWAQKEWA